jgi:carboxylate-amine ligase
MASVGATLGVEEEFHLLHPATGRLAPGAQRLLDASGPGTDLMVKELQRSMIELSTPVCTDLDAVATALAAGRRALVDVADRVGLWVAAAGTVPDSGTNRAIVYPDDRYRHISDEYQQLANEQQVCACQTQVGVPDPDLAVRIIPRIRGWLPTLLALSAGSPYFQHVDTGYDSYRAIVVGRWPTAGPPPLFRSHSEYQQAVDRLVSAGVIDDVRMIYYDVRPSPRYPTLEIRIGDACPRVDDVVVLAGLARALVVTGAAQDGAGAPLPHVADGLLRGATWRAARSGLRGRLIDPIAGEAVRAPDLVHRLLDHVRSAAESTGDWEYLADGVDALLRRGTSAERQRRALNTGAGEVAVVASVVAETRTVYSH